MASTRVKALLLLLLLGLPVLLYLFLQGFGENEYSIPVFYEDGVPNPKTGCTESKNAHSIETLLKGESCEAWNCSQIEGKLVLFGFIKSGGDEEPISEMARVCNLFQDQTLFRAVTLSTDPGITNVDIDQKKSQYSIKPGTWSWWSFDDAVYSLVNCGFNLDLDDELSKQVVLVDHRYRIRGYYQADDPEDIDRLVTEISILLTEIKS